MCVCVCVHVCRIMYVCVCVFVYDQLKTQVPPDRIAPVRAVPGGGGMCACICV